ncbi:MAG: FAD-dependent oxidoreductase [Bacteroidia bacterium]
MKSYKYIIAGGGVAAGIAAQKFIELGVGKGELAIISDDNTEPYHRPPLSKGFLAGNEEKENLYINKSSFYEENGIDVLLNTLITGADFAQKILSTEGGKEIKYEKLLIATGSRLRKFDVPGIDLPGLHYLRTMNDSRDIRSSMKKGKKAVTIGGSYISMETAAVCAQNGMEVTMVFPERRVMEKFFTPEMSQFFEKYFKERGVSMMPNESVASFSGIRKVTLVVLQSGRQVGANLVIAGIGVDPAIEPFRHTLIKINKGIVVNEYLETNQPDVYAAGDITRYKDLLFNTDRRLDHWDNAKSQAIHAVNVIMGKREPYNYLPYYFSEVFDLSFEYWGDEEEADEIVYRGDVESNSFSTWWLSNGRLMAAFVMGRPEEEREKAQEWIKEKKMLNGEELEAAESLSDL